jgi:3-hydroxyisobutyrate dehydrogenase
VNVAWIGVGNMGAPMARNVTRHGHAVAVFDVVAERRKALASSGARVAESLADCVRGADVVVTMLPAGEQVRDTYLGDAGVLAGCPPGALLVDCSTIAPATAREIAERAAARGLGMLDAPVSGGTAGAEAATLTFIVGGSESDLERARPLLDRLGKAVYHAGPPGAGQVVKMCNNLLLGIQMAGTCEALALGIAHGIEPARLSEIMRNSSGRNWVLEVYNPCPGVMAGVPSSRGYAGGFSSDLMLKDLRLAGEMACATGTATPLGSLACALYQLHQQQGRGQLDFSSVFADDAERRRLAGSLPDAFGT